MRLSVSQLAVREFMKMAFELPHYEFLSLIKIGSPDFSPPYYWWCPSARGHMRPCTSQIPWPIEFVTMLSNKYVFSERFPSLKIMSRCLNQWYNKQRWKAALSGSPDENPIRSKINKSRYTPPCSLNVCPILDSHLRDFLYKAHELCVFQMSRHKRASDHTCLSRCSSIGYPKIVKLAFQLISDGPYGVGLSDKDGCMVVYRKCVLPKALDKMLVPPLYRKYSLCNETYKRLHFEYLSNAKLLSQDDPSLYSALTRSLRTKGISGIVCRIDFTAKTHKPQGDAKLRLLHGAASHPWAPAMRFISKKLDEILRNSYSFLLRNSGHLCRKLRSLKLDRGDSFMLVDVKDYFMTGDHDLLVKNACDFFPSTESETVKPMLKLILDNQFLSNKFGDSATYKVVMGSGMGMPCAGEVSDASLCTLLEKRLLSHENPMHDCIKFYARFKDDILMVVRGDEAVRTRLLAVMQSYSHPFELVLAQVGRQEINYLDITIGVDESTGCAVFKPYVKPSSLARPLPWSSGHPDHVHLSWPRAQLIRLASISQSRVHYLSAAKHFLSWLLTHDPLNGSFLELRHFAQTLTPGVQKVLRSPKVIEYESTISIPWTPHVSSINRLARRYKIRVACMLSKPHLIRTLKLRSRRISQGCFSCLVKKFFTEFECRQ